MSIDIVGAVTAVYEIVGPKLLRQCGYIVSCNSHASDLKREIKNLKDASDSLRRKADLADSVGDIIEQEVWTWLTDAEELIKSKNLILQKNNVISCFGFVPNPKARYVLGRGAQKSLPVLRDLIEKGKFDQVSYHPVAELASEVKVRSATTSSSTVRYVDLKSRALVLKRIMADLNDHNKVGVYGMGGVGKTTLLKDVEKRARESGKFDDVITVFVSQAPNIDVIKSKIRNKLGSLGSNEDEANKKTLLILLDDLWSKLKGVDTLENSSKVKVKWVITSRKEELLAEGMDCYPTICLDVLEEEEGWELFGELVNNSVEDMKKNPAIVALLQKCARLPVSIEALANVLEKKGLSSSDLVIKDVLKLGKESINGSASLELSYNYLGDTDVANLARSLFRIIGLLGTPTVPILTLLKYTIGLGLLGSSNNSSSDSNIMERGRRQVSTSLRMLQDASLLLESDDTDYVKIHDIVRDVAASIASRDDHALIFNLEDGLSLKGWSKEKMKKSTSVYLPYAVIPKLNEGWECPELSIFIMEAGPAQGGHVLSGQKKRRAHVKLPSSFYKGMAKLKIVDLRNARLTSLPSSIQSDLRNVTTLFLHFCCIEDVSVIGKLKSLQILSFVGSDLAHLPKEIGELTKLRMLDLSQCSKLKTIEPGTLKRLTRLEELYIKESFDMWEVEGAEQPSNSSLAELNSLPRLRTLEVCVPDTNTLPLKLPLGDLVRYKVLIGDSWEWSAEYRESRTLKFKDNSKNILNEDWLQSALQTTQQLSIDGLSGARGSFHAQCKERFKELKHLHLQNSSSIQYIIWSTEWLDCRAFTILESMILEKMDSLEKICHGLVNSTSFSKLKVVRVQECHKLLSLFNLSLVNSLAELEEIEVSDCKVITEIVTAEEMDDNDGTDTEDHKEGMKKGCSDNLFGCPIKRSKGMARADYVIKLGNLRRLTLINLPMLRTFFGNDALSESMETTGHVLLNDQKAQSCKRKKFMQASRYKEIPRNTHLELDKLQRLELMDCKNIVHFLSSSMLLKLIKLESLTIARCESLEDIFDLNGVDAKSGDVEILPMLSELKLRELPKLEHIWKKNDMQIKGCQSLATIEIYQCSSLLYVSSSSLCDAMENLTEISVWHCNMMKTVFLERGLSKSESSVVIGLRSLKNIVISHCPNLKTFLSGNRQKISTGVAIGFNVASSTTFKDNNKGIPYWCCGIQADDLVDTSSFFNPQVFLPELESLFFSSAGEFEKLWSSEVPAKSYCNLEFLHVEKCQNLLTVIPASIIERLQKLKHLMANDCEKLESVIDLVVDWGTKKKHKALILPLLQELKLESLDSLRRIIETNSDDVKIVVGFPNLKRVDVFLCKALTHLIPAATATTLLKLEQLDIQNCAELKEVVYGEVSERNKMNDVFAFPHLTSLIMYHLDNLICFCSESYSLDFPCLKDLRIQSCKNLKTLVKPRADGHLGSQDEDRSNTTTHAFFNDKVRLPSLERFYLFFSKVEQLWGDELPMGSFCKLQELGVSYCLGLGNIIPSFLANRLQNLESISINGCGSLEDMFKITSQEPTERISLTKLTTLELSSDVKFDNLLSGRYILELPSLKKLILTTATAILEKVHFPNIEALYVSSNEEISELWHGEPRIGSFCKLKLLGVYGCEQLKKVIPLFMLERLQNLEELQVHNCGNLETVCELDNRQDVGETSDSNQLPCLSPFRNLTSVWVNNCKSLISLFGLLRQRHQKGTFVDDSTTNNKRIVVPQLNKLRLEDLPNFRHLFHDVLQLHGGQYTLEFPSLKDFFLINAGAKEAVTQKVVFPEKLEIREHDEVTFFGSTSSVLKEIMEALLSNQNYQRIGLLGSLGSYQFMELERQVKEEADVFDEVLLIDDFNIDAKSLQEELGRKLGIIYGITGEQGIRAQILQKSLLSKGLHKRLLFLLEVSETMDLEAVGIPRKGLDPTFFKQIFVSEDREVLVKMGAQLVIDIGVRTGEKCYILEKLSKCDSKVALFPTFHKQELQVDTPRNDFSLFNVGSKTTYDLRNSIMEDLETHQSDQIIGILGSYHEKLFMAVSYQLKLTTAFDVVYLRGNSDADKIQERLGRRLGITYSERSEKTERAQHLHESLLSNKDKSLLLLACDLVEDVNLEDFGIPKVGELDPKLLKIILVSEKREVLDQMGAQHVIDIGDTSHLWWSHKISDECGCDQLLKILAKKLKGKGLPAWEIALQRLQDSPFEYEARKKVVDSLFLSDDDEEEERKERQAIAGSSNL